MSGHQHIPKNKQINKIHSRNRKQGGKVEKKGINSVATPKKDMTKDDRFNRAVQIRKNKKDKMIADRRGLKKMQLGDLSLNDTADLEVIKSNMLNVAPKLVAIIPLNEHSDPEALKNMLTQELLKQSGDSDEMQTEDSDPLRAYAAVSGGNLGFKNQRLMFHICERDIYSILDISKVADIILFSISCKNAEVEKVKDDPDMHANAIDETGYKILSALRTQGIPPSIGILEHIESIPIKKRNQIKKLFHRYFVSEFSDDYKFHTIDGSTEGLLDSSYKNLIRLLTSTFASKKLFWKENRSFMLCNKYEENKGDLVVEGYIKHNYLSCNRYGHITGYGDFKIKQILASQDPYCTKNETEKRKKATADDNMEPSDRQIDEFTLERADPVELENEVNPFGAEQTWPTNEEIENKGKLVHDEYKHVGEEIEDMNVDENIETGFKVPEAKKEDLDQLASKFNKMQIQVLDGDNRSEPDFEDDEDDFDLGDDYQSQLNKSSYRHEKLTNIERRANDEMDFPDEVDTPTDIPARERFQQYRSINNIRTCNWDAFETLPLEYAKIWRFENFTQVKKAAILQSEKEGLPIDGTYVRLILEPLDEKSINSVETLKLAKEKQNLVFSTLMPHERKVIVSHFKIKRNEEDRNAIPSKAILEFHVGFRRFLTKPLFSDDYVHTNKAKYYRFLPHDAKVLVSAYMPVCFPNSQVIVFRKGDGQATEIGIDYDTHEPTLVASGTVAEPDPLKIILKRILLTGYPIKCKSKRAVVRFMFFNKDDIHYFRPVELHTKFGLRGRIKESLGTHGMMK
jgi:pre-rRNA-processing protein TSR1